MKPLVYIAAPYSNPDPVVNTHKAIKFGLELFHEGIVTPIIPHLSLLAHLVDPQPYEVWLGLDRDQLVHCDALLWDKSVLPGVSLGADQEVDFAVAHRIPVFWQKASLYEWAKGLSDCLS